MAANVPLKKENIIAPQKIETIPPLIKDPLSRQYLPTAPTPLGTGGFASVFRAKVVDRRLPPESTECALKVVRTQTLQKTSKQLRSRFRYELAIHNKLRHPHIVAFHRAFRFQDLTYVALELAENGSLTDVMKRRKYLTMPEIRRYMIQLCGALDYLHAREIVHRDVKAGNVFLDSDMNIKLGDFGLAAVLEPSPDDASLFNRRTTFCGTPNYLAPELLSRTKGHATGVDIWALGVLLFYLAVGCAPFHAKNKEDIYRRVMQQKYTWPTATPEGLEANDIPQPLKDLVMSILVEEEHRPTCATIVSHAFFRHGFLPDRIDALARTRRPRWARAAASTSLTTLTQSSASGVDSTPEDSESHTYRALITASFAKPGPTKRGRLTSVLLDAEREVAEGVVLEVPLPEGFVYQRWHGGQRALKRKKLADAADVEHGAVREGVGAGRGRTGSVRATRGEGKLGSVRARAAAIESVEGELNVAKRRVGRERSVRVLREVGTAGNRGMGTVTGARKASGSGSGGRGVKRRDGEGVV